MREAVSSVDSASAVEISLTTLLDLCRDFSATMENDICYPERINPISPKEEAKFLGDLHRIKAQFYNYKVAQS